MGAILLDGVVVEKNAMVAAGALVRQNTKVPSGEVCLAVVEYQNACKECSGKCTVLYT